MSFVFLKDTEGHQIAIDRSTYDKYASVRLDSESTIVRVGPLNEALREIVGSMFASDHVNMEPALSASADNIARLTNLLVDANLSECARLL